MIKKQQGNITGSCGHVLGQHDGDYGLGINAVTKTVENDESPSVTHGTYCKSCVKQLDKLRLLLHSVEEQEEWMSSFPLKIK